MKNQYAIIQILLCIAIVGGSILILFHYVGGYPFSQLVDWANFATYLSVSLSIISVIYIFLTYRSQISMSSIVQFESTFFQWYQIHMDLMKRIQPEIDACVSNTILPKLNAADFQDLGVFEELAHKGIERPLHMYYRSLFQLFKYIKLSPILSGYSQRKKYYDIIQSNMSDTELLLFLCFVLGDENRDKKIFGQFGNKMSFKDLIDEGHVLKNCYVSDEALLRRMTPIVRRSFPKTAIKSFHFFVEKNVVTDESEPS